MITITPFALLRTTGSPVWLRPQNWPKRVWRECACNWVWPW